MSINRQALRNKLINHKAGVGIHTALINLRLGQERAPHFRGTSCDHPGACLVITHLVHAGDNENSKELNTLLLFLRDNHEEQTHEEQTHEE